MQKSEKSQTNLDKVLKPGQYEGYTQHLRAIEDALMADAGLSEAFRDIIHDGIVKAFQVGQRTITTDTWCDEW